MQLTKVFVAMRKTPLRHMNCLLAVAALMLKCRGLAMSSLLNFV